MKVKSEEPAIEPASATASTGRRGRSTSAPQTRRKRRAKTLIPLSVARGLAAAEETAKASWALLRPRFLGHCTRLDRRADVLLRALPRLLGPLAGAAHRRPHLLD